MTITVFGAGNIGLVTALCLCEQGHKVYCIDSNQKKIQSIKSGIIDFFEPGLDELLAQQLSKKSIFFLSSATSQILNDSNLIFIAVGTPNSHKSGVDLSAVQEVCQNIHEFSHKKQSIIIKSTVPPGTNLKLSQEFPDFHFISCPEFLREGTAIQDTKQPDRIIIGCLDKKHESVTLLRECYDSFNLPQNIYIYMSPNSAEMCKYAANIFLAARVSLINEIALVSEDLGADIKDIRLGLGSDLRIGPHFLNSGIGFGGSCFPKDLRAFENLAHNLKKMTPMTSATLEANKSILNHFIEKIKANTPIKKNRLSILGLSFKPETDDIREAPSLTIVKEFLAAGYSINIYDPKALENVRNLFGEQDGLYYFSDPYEALKSSQAAIFCTEWDEFKEIDLKRIKTLMSRPCIFDGRHIFNSAKATEFGFLYYAVGLSV